MQQEKDYTQKFDLSLWRKLLRYAPRYKKHLAALAFFMGINALIDVAFPLMTSYAIDRLIAGNADAPGANDSPAIFSAPRRSSSRNPSPAATTNNDFPRMANSIPKFTRDSGA